MAGIYVHIPFCKKICHYCDFYKTASLKLEDEFVNSILKEIKFRNGFLEKNIETIYFGGGTPSAIRIAGINSILDEIKHNFVVSEDVELTIEVNPDDITLAYLKSLKRYGFNRLSIGTQSFNNSILNYLNRRHDSLTSKDCIELALKAGFNNISADLIYGIADQTFSDIENDINILASFPISHISAYHLTIEDKTYFGKLHKLNKLKIIDENLSVEQYKFVVKNLKSSGFVQYEISNFARNSNYSKHNTNYWRNISYLGLGPSAHSYTGNTRFWNITPVTKYIEALNGNTFFETEFLTTNDLFNEYLLVSFRTIWGISLDYILDNFGKKYYDNTIRIYSKNKKSIYLRRSDNNIFLTTEGMFLSDMIIQEYFITN